MYPALHGRVMEHLRGNQLAFQFHDNDDDDTAIQIYDTNIMGYFPCRNRSCKAKGWFSGHVGITIRLYSDESYNARVYFQRCTMCETLSRVRLDEDSYVERVVYRLRRWSDIPVERPPYSNRDRAPHLNHLCMGCQRGHCQAGRLH